MTSWSLARLRFALAAMCGIVLWFGSGAVAVNFAQMRCHLAVPLAAISSTHPVPGIAFSYVSDGGRAKSSPYCIDYVIVNNEPHNWLAIEWVGTPLRTYAGAGLAPGGRSSDSFLYAVENYYDPPGKPSAHPIRFGRDFQFELPTLAYDPPVQREATMVRDRLGAHALGVRSGPTTDFDLSLVTALNPRTRRFITQLVVKNVRGDVRLGWFPRTDEQFVKVMNAGSAGLPYRLRPGTFMPEAFVVPAGYVPQVRLLPTQVWIGARLVLDAYLPGIVPTQIR